jgi:assimilatory nitrate reductase catalytic subunit
MQSPPVDVYTAAIPLHRHTAVGNGWRQRAAALRLGLIPVRPLQIEPQSVGAATIATAVESGCATVAAVGQKVKAGTNCGSCRPEIARLIVACDVGREK